MAHWTWQFYRPFLDRPLHHLLHSWAPPTVMADKNTHLCWFCPHELMLHFFKWTPLFSGSPITPHSSYSCFLHISLVTFHRRANLQDISHPPYRNFLDWPALIVTPPFPFARKWSEGILLLSPEINLLLLLGVPSPPTCSRTLSS